MIEIKTPTIFPKITEKTYNLKIDLQKNKNIFFFYPIEILIEFECMRCRSKNKKLLSNNGIGNLIEINENKNINLSDSDFEFTCKCSNIIFCNFHHNLITKNMNIYNTNLKKYIFGCMNCNSFFIDDKILNNCCFNCNEILKIKIIEIESKSLIKDKRNKTFTYKKGQALPDHGICKHYKKSKHWFLFPCCNLLYPCDICHNENEQHLNMFSNKLLCGYCSTFNCTSCKESAHWNNGKGCRDKKLMSKKDKQKYKR